MLNEWWSEQSPERRRHITLLGGSILVIGVLYWAVSGSDSTGLLSRPRAPEVDRNLLTGTNPRDIGIDSLANKQADAEKELDKLRKQVADTESKQANKDAQLAERLERLTDVLAQTTNRTRDDLLQMIEGKDSDWQQAFGKLKEDQKKRDRRTAKGAGPNVPVQEAKQAFEAAKPTLTPAVDKVGPAPRAQADKPMIQPEVVITVYGETEKAPVEEVDEEAEGAIYLPAGSIVSGTLLTGLDAPTEGEAKGAPIPVLLRIKHEAILPNHYRLDVRECFAILGAYGDMSSERAFMRGETLSCIRRDGGVIETPFNTYAVGEDGKNGLRGRLVNRSGTMLARAMLAGGMSALADIMRPVQVQSINTDPTSSVLYQTPKLSGAAEAASFAGASNAMGRLAEYYADLAEETYPVIEIDVGRRVEVVLTKGVTLKLRESGTAQAASTHRKAG